MSGILAKILEQKRAEIAAAKVRESASDLAARARTTSETPRGFRDALESGERPRVIAELKRRSPSKGEIRPDFDPLACASAYAKGGAAAMSVLTDEQFFGGSLAILEAVRRNVSVPLLRKDFLIDPYQIDEARAAGADAVLLIVRALEPTVLAELRAQAEELGLDVLVEVHDEVELDTALEAGADLIGINNRDLHTFKTDLAVCEALAPRVAAAGAVVVGESGIFTYADIERLEAAGAHAVLVGEALMRQDDVAQALRELRGVS